MASNSFLQKYQVEINLEILSTIKHSKNNKKEKKHSEVLNKIKQVGFLKTFFWNNFRQRKTEKTVLTIHIYSLSTFFKC